MDFTPDNIYHIFNQGNDGQPIFTCDKEYEIFLEMIRENILAHSEIISWCLMPNHFHLMIYTDERVLKIQKQGGLHIDVLTNGIRKLKTKSKCLSDFNIKYQNNLQDYYFNCFHYLHQNPFVAALVKRMEDWKYSSFRDYADLRKGTLCNKFLAAKFCSYNPDTFLETSYKIITDFDF